MEKTVKRESVFYKVVLPVVALGALAFAMVSIVYGVDAMAAGAHDAFHDFRHVIGMPCH